MEYKLSGELNFDDFMQFQKMVLKRKFLSKRWIIIFCVFAFIVIVSMIDLTGNEKSVSKTTFIIPIVIIGMFGLIVLRLKKSWRKSFESNKQIQQRCDYMINKEGIITNTESGSSTLTKDKIYEILFDKDSIYIFMADNMAKIIKKRFVANGEKYNEMVLFIKTEYKECFKP
jgi:hypothetical protein